VGVVISRITTRPPGRTTRAISRHALVEVVEVAGAEAHGRRGELAVGVSQRQRVARLEADRRLLDRARGEHLLGEVHPDDLAAGRTREASSIARSPVPVATSSTRSPGPTDARSAARARQRWCIPAVMTEFIAS
jgi:hypothetical protein